MADFSLLNAHLANIGAQVSPPSGSSSSVATSITHHEVKAEDVALPDLAETEVVALASFTPAAGSTVQLSALICYQDDGDSVGDAISLEVRIKNNGAGLLQFTTMVPSVSGGGEPTVYNYAAAIPIVSFEVADGTPSVYSVTVQNNTSTDGEQRVVTADLIANVLA